MVFSALNQSFSFHSSPESFISSRLQDLALSDPGSLPSAAGKNQIVIGSILNRKVHIVSSYQLCRDVLNASSLPTGTIHTPSTIVPVAAGVSNGDGRERIFDADTLVAGPAYDQLMSAFFPPPNILLEDGTTHSAHKQAWVDQLSTFPSDTTSRVRQIAEEHVSLLFHPTVGGADGTIDLYDKLKSLSWEVLLGVFLGVSSSSSPAEFSKIESLQESLLRGQFSLFPVSINARLWQSARSKGINARKDLQVKLREIIGSQEASCPFLKQGKVSKDDAAHHALLFTSSLAVKALSSLLTAFVLNLFLWRDPDDEPRSERGGDSGGKSQSTSLADLVRSQGDQDSRSRMLRSILLETERLSPPVVGVMRRVQRDIILKPDTSSRPPPSSPTATSTSTTTTNHSTSFLSSATTNHPVPAGHDIWLYLSGASRDPTIFGEDADIFHFDRYMSSFSSSSDPDIPPGLAFGDGPKSCLGTELVRQILLTVGQVMVEAGVEMEGTVEDRGVRGWLGWEGGVGPEWTARGMKQLPVQRPREVVRVSVKRGGVEGKRGAG